MCNGVNCDLTSNLSLGKQGSDKQKYFPGDKVAEVIVKQNCYQRPSGTSSFSEYRYITLTTDGDTVRVDYKVMYFGHGTESFNEGSDLRTLLKIWALLFKLIYLEMKRPFYYCTSIAFPLAFSHQSGKNDYSSRGLDCLHLSRGIQNSIIIK